MVILCVTFFVAAKMSNSRVTDTMRERSGIMVSNYVREQSINTELKRKAQKKAVKSKEHYINRRKKTSVIKAVKGAKSKKEPSRHKSEKLSPKEDCKYYATDNAEGKKKVTAKRNICSNCGQSHADNECPEPKYTKKQKIAARRTNEGDNWFKETFASCLRNK
jgi:ribosomal protein S27AE